MKLQKDLREFIELLNSHGVEYDLLTEVSGVSFDEAWSTRVAAHLDGLPVQFPSLPVLLRNKDAAGRPRAESREAVVGQFEDQVRRGWHASCPSAARKD